MERGQPYIEMRLNVPGAIELGDFVSAFTSLASAYDHFVEREDPKAAKAATLYVQEVRQGSYAVAVRKRRLCPVHDVLSEVSPPAASQLVADQSGTPARRRPCS